MNTFNEIIKKCVNITITKIFCCSPKSLQLEIKLLQIVICHDFCIASVSPKNLMTFALFFAAKRISAIELLFSSSPPLIMGYEVVIVKETHSVLPIVVITVCFFLSISSPFAKIYSLLQFLNATNLKPKTQICINFLILLFICLRIHKKIFFICLNI